MGKWENRHDKPFNCKWKNYRVFASGLRIGNKDTVEIVFTGQLAKIKSKGLPSFFPYISVTQFFIIIIISYKHFLIRLCQESV